MKTTRNSLLGIHRILHRIRVLRYVLASACAGLWLAGAAQAQSAAPVQVQDAWVRATVKGQQGTGGFMTLTASENLRLVGVQSPVAGVAEIHEMRMGANQVMQMRAIASLALPKGVAVALKPGGHHLMLMDLHKVLAAGSQVPVTLRFVNPQGRELRQTVQLPVQLASSRTAQQQPANSHEHEHEAAHANGAHSH